MLVGDNSQVILFLACLSGLATIIGAWFGAKKSGEKNAVIFGMTFAAVIMLLIAVLELLPQASAVVGVEKTAGAFMVGVALIIFFNFLIPHIHTIKEMEKCRDKCLVRMPFLIALGLILHDFPEGVALANSYNYTSNLGILVAAALFAHNLPEGYILSAAAPPGKRNHFWSSAWMSVISTLGGTILGILLINQYTWLNPFLTALAAGAMVYISVHELLPAVNRMHDRKQIHIICGLIAAITIYWLLSILK